MRYVREIYLEASQKKIKIDTSKITAPEFRFATAKDTDEAKSDAIIAKSCGMSTKELQNLPFPDYQFIIRQWWNVVLTPIEDNKQVEFDEADLQKYGLQYGQIIKLVKAGEEQPPNSQSASTSD